jgi:hypothetical protein
MVAPPGSVRAASNKDNGGGSRSDHMRAGGVGWLAWNPLGSTIVGVSGSSSTPDDNGTSGGGGLNESRSPSFMAPTEELKKESGE